MNIRKLVILLFFSSIHIATTSKAQDKTYRSLNNKSLAEFENRYINRTIKSNNIESHFLQKNLNKSTNTNSIDSVVAVETNGNKSRLLLTHNEMGKVTYELEQQNDGSGWINYSQTMYGYNSEGYNTEYQFDYWENGEWEPYRKSAGDFDVNGNQILLVEEAFYDGAWEKNSRYSWEIDENGNNTVFLIEFWENDSWANGMRWTSVFNGEGLETSTILSRYENDDWTDEERTTYEYDENGNEILNTVEYLVDEYFNDTRTTSSYDDINRLVTQIRESLIDEVWTNISKYFLTYDADGNLESWTYQNWIVSDWYDLLRNSYVYSESGNITFIAEAWNGSSWQPDNSFLDFADGNGNSIYIYGSVVGIFFSTVTDVENEKLTSNEFILHQNYPNPFNPSTTIKYSIPPSSVMLNSFQHHNLKLSVYDLLGRKIKTLVNENQHPGNYEVTFDASNLPSGIYYYQLKTGDFVKTRKMMLLK